MVPRRMALVVLAETGPARVAAVMAATVLVQVAEARAAMAENLEEAVTVAQEETLGAMAARVEAELTAARVATAVLGRHQMERAVLAATVAMDQPEREVQAETEAPAPDQVTAGPQETQETAVA